jgi:hypothetical protein
MTIVDLNLRNDEQELSGESVGPRICRALRLARLRVAVSSDVYCNSDRALDACAADAEGRGEEERGIREDALCTMQRYRRVVETLETMDVVNPDRDLLRCLEQLLNIHAIHEVGKEMQNVDKAVASVRPCLRGAAQVHTILSIGSIDRTDVEGRALHATKCIREIIVFIKQVLPTLCDLSVRDKDTLILTRSWLYNIEQEHDAAVTVQRCERLERMLLRSVSRILRIDPSNGPSFAESFVTLRMPKRQPKQQQARRVRWTDPIV